MVAERRLLASVRDRALRARPVRFEDTPKPEFRPIDDVSPWPQADRVNPTRGELAEDATIAWNLAKDQTPLKELSHLLSMTCNQSIEVIWVVEKGQNQNVVPVPSTALGYVLDVGGQPQICHFPEPSNSAKR